MLPARRRRAAGGHGRRVESTGSVARPTGCHRLRGIGRDELLTIAPGGCRWRRRALRCPHTAGPGSRSCAAHRRGRRPGDSCADQEDRCRRGKPRRRSQGDLAPRPLHLTRSTSLLPHTPLRANSGGRPARERPRPRARQAKRELQLEIRQLRGFQKSEEAELKREEKIEKGLEKSGRAR